MEQGQAVAVRSVLIIEDDVWLRRMLERALGRRGFAVLSAANSADARARSRECAALDLVVTDLMFPGDGLDALIVSIRRDHPVVRVIVVSGYDLEDSDQLRQLGDVTFLAKPFTPSQLDARVRRIFGDGEMESA